MFYISFLKESTSPPAFCSKKNVWSLFVCLFVFCVSKLKSTSNQHMLKFVVWLKTLKLFTNLTSVVSVFLVPNSWGASPWVQWERNDWLAMEGFKTHFNPKNNKRKRKIGSGVSVDSMGDLVDTIH